MVITTDMQIARVVCGDIKKGHAVMVQLKNGDIQRAIIAVIL